MLRRGNILSASIVSLHNANTVHNELDKINKGRMNIDIVMQFSWGNQLIAILLASTRPALRNHRSYLHIPYFGVDIEEIMKNIIITSEIDPALSRHKYFLATVRGVEVGLVA